MGLALKKAMVKSPVFMLPLALVFAIAAAALFVGCVQNNHVAPVAQNGTQNQSANVTIYAAGSEVHVAAEVADTEAKRELGLMFRQTLANGTGMLFVFDAPGDYAFYMKGMAIPLDIIYIGKAPRIEKEYSSPQDYTILKIRRSFQPCVLEPCELDYSGGGTFYGLEVPSGWADANGVLEGQTVRIGY